jgi:hypothetical protein
MDVKLSGHSATNVAWRRKEDAKMQGAMTEDFTMKGKNKQIEEDNEDGSGAAAERVPR